MGTCYLSNERLENYREICIFTDCSYETISDDLVKHMIKCGVKLFVDEYDSETNTLYIDFRK